MTIDYRSEYPLTRREMIFGGGLYVAGTAKIGLGAYDSRKHFLPKVKEHPRLVNTSLISLGLLELMSSAVILISSCMKNHSNSSKNRKIRRNSRPN